VAFSPFQVLFEGIRFAFKGLLRPFKEPQELEFSPNLLSSDADTVREDYITCPEKG
jgi:hypothetical protein